MCGALFAHLEFHKNTRFQFLPKRFTVRLNARHYDAIGWLGLALIVISIFVVDRNARFPGWWVLLPVLGTSLIVWVGPKAPAVRRALSSPALVWIGLISYPLYLWHWPLLTFARITEFGEPSHTIILVAVVISFGLAWLTYRLVEVPIRFGKIAGERSAQGLLVTLVAIGALGFVTYDKSGFPARLQQAVLDGVSPKLFGQDAHDCKKKFPFAAKGSCILSTSDLDSRRITLMIGDSHSEALARGFEDFAKNMQSKSVYLEIGQGGCLPFLGVERFTRDGPSECPEVIGEALGFAVKNERVQTAIIVARYAVYVSANGFGMFDQYPLGNLQIQAPGARLAPEQANSVEVFRAGLIRTLDFLQERKIQIIFVHQVPELGFDPRSCVKSGLFRISHERSPCALPRQEIDVRQKQYREIVSSVLARYPLVKVIDPLQYLCDDNLCYGMKDGILLYYDHTHLNLNGATYLLGKFKFN